MVQTTEVESIKLTEKQLQIIGNILGQKQTLEAEYKRLIERETEFVVTVCEAKGIEATGGIKIEDGLMIVPKPEKKELDTKKKK